jgi:CheY-like chemotaxis protein
MLAYAGKGKFFVEPLDLSALIPEMCGLVRPSISKKISLRLELDPELLRIDADRGQLQQVFMNLTLNAAEAIGGQDGLITVRTSVQVVDGAYLSLHPEIAALPLGQYVCLEVLDTGSGMDDATKAKIFDPFFSTKFVGRGLGLAAVAGILRGHKGEIVVSSSPGKGSCFRVLFPALAREAIQQQVTNGTARLGGAGVVLIVDDEPKVRDMAKRALERYGYTVLLADSGLTAIEIFRRHSSDIAVTILDLNMPVMGGPEALPELRKIQPAARIVASSGYSASEALAMFEGEQIQGFIQKPFTAQALAKEVKAGLA